MTALLITRAMSITDALAWTFLTAKALLDFDKCGAHELYYPDGAGARRRPPNLPSVFAVHWYLRTKGQISEPLKPRCVWLDPAEI
jgi:hypothetical protein